MRAQVATPPRRAKAPGPRSGKGGAVRPEGEGMKVQCETCDAKYAIADEKVAGRAFKIRCKKCSTPIVIRGDQVQEPDGDGGVWYALIAGAQSGPWTEGAMERKRDAGEVAEETLVWREGMADWQPWADVFAPPGLFASQPEPSPFAPPDASLTGTRNESSVLFSLSNLSSLTPARSLETSKAPARTEGSGLIDIRALAASPMRSASPEPADREDDLLAIGAPVSGLGAPMIAPAQPPKRNSVAIVAGVVGVIAVLATAAVVAVALTRPERPTSPPQVAEAGAEPARLSAPATAATGTIAPAAVQPPPDVESPETTSSETAPVERADAPVVARSTRSERPASRPRARPERTARPTPPSSPSPPPERSLTELVEDAVNPDVAPRRATRPATPVGPETPNRGDVRRAMDGVSAAVRGCGDGGAGRVVVEVTFASEGSVR
ncbi:MAG TPA: hypothetical protein DEF51_39600, partial [Myxococcales bacterium]|nr:hypothetical protein [Myxococcales bacterium]